MEQNARLALQNNFSAMIETKEETEKMIINPNIPITQKQGFIDDLSLIRDKINNYKKLNS